MKKWRGRLGRVAFGLLARAGPGVPPPPPPGRIRGSPLARVLRLEERLARGSLARDRSRTALTLGALVVGLAMIVALGWTAQAARNAATAWLTDVGPGDGGVTSIFPVPPAGLLS